MGRKERRRAQRLGLSDKDLASVALGTSDCMAPYRANFTQEQTELMVHTGVILQREQIKQDAIRQADAALKALDEEWKARWNVAMGEDQDATMEKLLGLLLTIPTRILCEKFGWESALANPKGDLTKFASAVVKEVNSIFGDTDRDIFRYAKESYDLYGITYTVEDAPTPPIPGEERKD